MTDDIVWYRYEDIRYAAPLDEYENPIGRGSLEVRLTELPVIRITPKGAIVGWGRGRFVKRDARRRYACPTKSEALESFRARKSRQVNILSRQLADAKMALALCDEVDPSNGGAKRFRTPDLETYLV